MKDNPRGGRKVDSETAWSSLLLFGFGIMLLLFLVAIERQNWFHIKPASGTAAAMSYASSNNTSKS